MSTAKGSELLIIIPTPGIGHLVSAVDFANTIRRRENRFTIAILIISPIFDQEKFAEKVSGFSSDITLINVPPVDPSILFTSPPKAIESFASLYIEAHRVNAAAEVRELVSSDQFSSVRFVVDMFCTSMIDVANEFKASSYIFFPSNIAFLGLLKFLETRSEFGMSEESDSIIRGLSNPVPKSVLPGFVFSEETYTVMAKHAKRFDEAKGIIINTCPNLEQDGLRLFQEDKEMPPIYAIGPLLDLGEWSRVSEKNRVQRDRIMKWLDEQEKESVVFLCFGSMGSFGEDQVKEIAIGLEKSGVKFLWALRKPAPAGVIAGPSDFADPQEVLPEGFLSRIGDRGFICGWAPQIEILAHNAIGGFVSHCGWNSTLEALWFGVPMATWPLYAEQQLNAFHMVRDLGLSVELKMDYRLKQEEVVTSAEIKSAVKKLMEDGEVRTRVRAMAESLRRAMAKGGSSFEATERLIADML